MQLEKNLEPILNTLCEFAENHFATEEKYFDLYQYEHSDEHKEQHKKLLSDLNKFKENCSHNDPNLINSILDFVEAWLVDHLSEHDQKYVKCFNEHGLS